MARRTEKGQVFNYSAPVTRQGVGAMQPAGGESKIIPWGSSNDLPHYYLQLLTDSGTASNCLQLLETFIQANGFSDIAAGKFLVNETQTADSLLEELSSDLASLGGLALRVRFTENRVMAEALPLECVRKTEDGRFAYNPTFGQKRVNNDLTEYLDGFVDAEALRLTAAEFPEQMAETGQLYYYYYKTKGAYDYPRPPYATIGGLADIENDTEISLYDLDEVKSGFRLNAIMTAIGNYEDVQDEEGNLLPNPELEHLKDTLKAFTSRQTTTEARKKIMLLTAPSAELAPKLEPFNNSKSLELLDAVTDRIANKVCRVMNVPPALVGLARPRQLGQSQEISNMIQLFQLRILKNQSLVQRVMEVLFPEIPDWTVSTLNPLQFIPDYLIPMLSDEEKQNLISRYI
jgi:hypothetical protein